MKTAKAVLVVLLFNIFCASRSHEIQSSVIDVKEGEEATGTWKTKVQWRYYWMKDWELKQMYVPTWKKVWTPIEIREWFPFPKPPPPPPLNSGKKLLS